MARMLRCRFAEGETQAGEASTEGKVSGEDGSGGDRFHIAAWGAPTGRERDAGELLEKLLPRRQTLLSS
jgi:hypothetical protein